MDKVVVAKNYHADKYNQQLNCKRKLASWTINKNNSVNLDLYIKCAEETEPKKSEVPKVPNPSTKQKSITQR